MIWHEDTLYPLPRRKPSRCRSARWRRQREKLVDLFIRASIFRAKAKGMGIKHEELLEFLRGKLVFLGIGPR